jgi:hypothetical protein
MIDIHVGEYVRTTQGYIARLESIYHDMYSFDNSVQCSYGEEMPIVFEKDLDLITKHSFNIIDLIEVGDYVKIGSKEYLDDFYSCVCNVGIAKRKFIELDCGGDGTEFIFDTNLIKLIITHEQMKFMEYKVGGDNECR